MGRTFENRKHAMMKRGARDSKNFTHCGRQITIAVKAAGGDPDSNPALRRAIQNARAVNMPKDKVQNAIDKALKLGDTSNFEQIFYEGYAAHGIALMVETATDNPTRTVANVRNVFNKCGGNLGNSGSVAFMFTQMGVFRLKPEDVDRDEMELELIDFGLEDISEATDDDGNPLLHFYCGATEFGTLQSKLEELKSPVVSSGFEWVPSTTTELDDEKLEDVLKLIGKLEEDDDVQAIFHNIG